MNTINKIAILSLSLFFQNILAENIEVRGSVKDVQGSPVQNVVITDGINFTSTNNKGEYSLISDTEKSRFVYMSIPSGFDIPNNKNIATGYYKELTGNDYNFVLQKRKESSDNFIFIPISDPQMKNKTHLKRYETETIPDLQKTISYYNGLPCYAMLLGDIVFDEMNLFDDYKSAMSKLDNITAFHVTGNHDLNLLYNDRDNTKPGDIYAEKDFEDTFGPVNYSFNIGKIHIIGMKDINYHKGKNYKEKFGETQLKWLRKDLSYVAPGTTVFINLHAPVFNSSEGETDSNADDYAEFRSIISPYNVHLFEGHTHFLENNRLSPNLYEHNIGAACGAWWKGNVNRCGAPNGYLVVEVNGNDIKWYYKSTGMDKRKQFKIYRQDEFKSQKDYIVANVWDWDTDTTVEWYADGIYKGYMDQFQDEDQSFITQNGKALGYKTKHLFRARPVKGTQSIEIKVTNRFGEIFIEKISL